MKPKIPVKDMVSLMGAKVVVTRRLHRTWPDDNKVTPITWEPGALPAPRSGWVVGVRYLQTGVRVPESGGGYNFDGECEYERPWLRQTGPNIPALLVSYFPTKKPVLVPLDGYRLWESGDPEPTIERWLPDDQYRQMLRDEMRREMKDWPREKGRWVKKTAVHP